jgi:hypothetical protein
MFEHILPVAGAVAQFAQRAHQLMMESVNAHFEYGALPRLSDLGLDFLAGFGDHLFDAGRMDPAVHDEFFQRDAGDLPADGIESRQDDSLGCVVDDEVDTGRSLQRADIASLATDDAPLHVVGGQRHHSYGAFGHMVGRALLNGAADDLAGPLGGVVARFVLDLPDHDRRVVARFLLNVPDQRFPGRLHRQP